MLRSHGLRGASDVFVQKHKSNWLKCKILEQEALYCNEKQARNLKRPDKIFQEHHMMLQVMARTLRN